MDKAHRFHLIPACILILTMPFVSALTGDIDGNNVVDIFDLVIVAQNFGLDSGYDERADLNNDNTIDIFDLVTVGINFGEMCP